MFGKLALETGKRIQVRVMESNAGFYIGTSDEEGPYSRESSEYWKTRKAAEDALTNRNWTQRLEP
ncbi:hypothetical protein [Uliginosibacterium gangwonense]|uniref:hypothetical protein n=1 Tax=Uliginosibacterium gangwonense TaxID=392736 RepID=UPI0003779077|nr:hypothetical protein [Uliginosibacterium gangwonense]